MIHNGVHELNQQYGFENSIFENNTIFHQLTYVFTVGDDIGNDSIMETN